MKKFTKGQWFWNGNMIYSEDKGQTICTVNDTSLNISDSEVTANAKLIAVAPEMFETLSVVLKHIEQTNTDFEFNGMVVPKTDLIKYIEMAIKKATE